MSESEDVQRASPAAPAASTEVRATDPETGGQKGVKIERFDLIPIEALEEVARIYGYGAQKYAEDNWRRGYPWRWSIGALFRHAAKFAMGEECDPESGYHHMAHAAFHCLTLFVFSRHRLGTDDRGRNAGKLPLE